MLRLFSRLVINDNLKVPFVRPVSTNVPLCFQVTNILCAEPLKKKKKMDPAIVRAREEKRRRKIEKQIRRLQKNARQLKPLDECEVPSVLLNPGDLKLRSRQLPELGETEVDARIRLIKDWSRYRHTQSLADIKMMDRIAYSQTRALEELRLESEELYQEAVQIDPTLLPFKVKGPVATPPIENYDSPDGEYIDISRKW